MECGGEDAGQEDAEAGQVEGEGACAKDTLDELLCENEKEAKEDDDETGGDHVEQAEEAQHIKETAGHHEALGKRLLEDDPKDV